MKAIVYVVATYHRWGDELHAFGTRSEAEECVMEYAREFWDANTLGRFPRSYTRLYDAWAEHDLWGSVQSRWELEEFEINLPAREEGTLDTSITPAKHPARARQRARSIATERTEVRVPRRIRSNRTVC